MNILKKYLCIISCLFYPGYSIYGLKHQYQYFPPARPKLTVILVVDQFAHSYIQQVEPFLKGGLKTLISNSVNYTNAYYPHAVPATAAGHTALSTGAYPSDHGMINNEWFIDNKEIGCDDDSSENAAVFAPTGTYDYGKSAHHIMTDTISDQLILASNPQADYTVYGLSLKSRAAICTAGRLGKAIWFDTQSGNFTSSKAYFNELPEWVQQYNKVQKVVMNRKEFSWPLVYPRAHQAYNFRHCGDNSFADVKSDLAGKKLLIDRTEKKPFDTFEKTPTANKLLLDLAENCIRHHIYKQRNNKLVLWVNISNLDKIGHKFGPHSLEAIDTIYHIDMQIKDFMKNIRRYVKEQDTLFLLTADHGVSPIVEILEKDNFYLGERVMAPELIKTMNEHAQKKYSVKNLVTGFTPPSFYIDHSSFDKLKKEQQTSLLGDLKKIIKKHPKIKHVWLYNELSRLPYDENSLEYLFKRQRYHGRTGDIICQALPYCQITGYKKGTGHRTPYEPDRHVPLFIYQKGNYSRKTILDRVSMLQVTPTLAHILNVPKPSCATGEILPGLFEEVLR